MNKIIKFEASWCNPCKLLSEELKDIDFETESLDVEENPHLTDSYKVRGVPTLIFLKGGEEVDRVVGFINKEKIKSIISRIYGQ